jgi:uncharacterized membrane protein YedE/YeeE
MNKKQTLTTNTKKEMFCRYGLLALVLTVFVAFAASVGILPVLAEDGDVLKEVVNIVIDIIGNAALYIGIIIILWGAFQIILAFRREDSEAISKQITTIVVGGVLVGFGALAGQLYKAVTGEELDASDTQNGGR